MAPSALDRPGRLETTIVLVACTAVLAMLAMFDNSARREHERSVAETTSTATTPVVQSSRPADSTLSGFPGPYAPVGVTR